MSLRGELRCSVVNCSVFNVSWKRILCAYAPFGHALSVFVSNAEWGKILIFCPRDAFPNPDVCRLEQDARCANIPCGAPSGKVFRVVTISGYCCVCSDFKPAIFPLRVGTVGSCHVPL